MKNSTTGPKFLPAILQSLKKRIRQKTVLNIEKSNLNKSCWTFKVVCIQEHVFQLNNFHNLNNFQTRPGQQNSVQYFEPFLVHFESISQSILPYLHTS